MAAMNAEKKMTTSKMTMTIMPEGEDSPRTVGFEDWWALPGVGGKLYKKRAPAVKRWEELCREAAEMPGGIARSATEEDADTVDVVVCPNAGAYIRVPRAEAEVATRAIRQMRDRARGILPWSEFKELYPFQPLRRRRSCCGGGAAADAEDAEEAEMERERMAEEAEVAEWLRRHPEVAGLSFQSRPIEPMD